MTISSEVNRSGPYNGNGLTTAFEYKFKILQPEHLQVIRTDANGTDRVLVLDTDYTVTGVGNDTGGNAIVMSAPLTGSKITLLLNVPFTQETDLENQGAYYAETVERALDLIVMRLQQLKERAARAVTIPPTYDAATIDQLISNILALSDKGAALEAVAAVAQYLEAVADVAGDIPGVAGLTQTAQQKATEAAQSAAAASGSAGLAAAYAVNPEDIEVPGAGGLFSAFHWYRKTLALYSSVAAGIAGMIHGSSAKADIIDDDEFAIADSISVFSLRKVLASGIVKYVARTLGLDFMVGFVPARASETAFTVGSGVGFFGGKKHSTSADTMCSLTALFGTGSGCLDTGVVQSSKTYFVYAVRNLADGTTRFVASLSATEGAVNIPTGWELLSGSRVGCILTNSSGQIIIFIQSGNEVWTPDILLITTNTSLAAGQMVLGTVPLGISVDALCSVDTNANAGGDASGNIGTYSGRYLVRCRAFGSNPAAATISSVGKVRTDSSARVYRSVGIAGTGIVSMYSAGWSDYQCKRLPSSI